MSGAFQKSKRQSYVNKFFLKKSFQENICFSFIFRLRLISSKLFVGKPKLLHFAMKKSQQIIGTHSYIIVNSDPTCDFAEDFPLSLKYV